MSFVLLETLYHGVGVAGYRLSWPSANKIRESLPGSESHEATYFRCSGGGLRYVLMRK
jgi:hypothetical protein